MPTPDQRIGMPEFRFSIADKQKVTDSFKDDKGNISRRGTKALGLLNEVEQSVKGLAPEKPIGLVVTTADKAIITNVVSAARQAGLGIDEKDILETIGIVSGNIKREQIPTFAVNMYQNEDVADV